MKPFVKICGLVRSEDAELAVSLGASHVGCVRTPSSPRRAGLTEVRAVFAAARSASRVLVFKDVPMGEIVHDALATGADWVQLYDASDSEVERFALSGVRVLRVYDVPEQETSGRDDRALPRFASEPSEECPVLLDVGGGGSGRRFDWELLGGSAPRFTFIAGGIRPDNVEELLEHAPYGIDLSSGVEHEPGVKDPEKLRRLFERIRRHRTWQRI